MADTLANPVVVSYSPDKPTPVSVNSDWVTIVAAGGADAADTAGVLLDPSTASDRILLDLRGKATHVALRVGYPVGATVSQDLIVLAAGRSLDAENGSFSDSANWERLQLANGNYACTIVTAVATDFSDGTLQYSDIDIKTGSNVYDAAGCSYMKLLISTAFASDADDSLVIVQAKLLN